MNIKIYKRDLDAKQLFLQNIAKKLIASDFDSDTIKKILDLIVEAYVI